MKISFPLHMLRLFSSIAFVVVPVIGQEQNIVTYDTSSGNFSLKCDPAPGVCELNRAEYSSYSCQYSTTVTSNPDQVCRSDGFNGNDASIVFTLADCEADNGACSIRCDSNCFCITTMDNSKLEVASNGVLQPVSSEGGGEGGEPCPILSTEDGSLTAYPTQQPSEAPSTSPTWDPETAIYYNATELNTVVGMSFDCGETATQPLCSQFQGNLVHRFSTSEISNVTGETKVIVGWSNCDSEDKDCILQCSSACICSVVEVDNGGDDSPSVGTITTPSALAPGDDCPLAELAPTLAPTIIEDTTMSPTTTTSSGSVSTRYSSLVGYSLIAVVAGHFWRTGS